MAVIPLLRDKNGEVVVVDDGESLNVEATLRDASENVIDAAAVTTLVLTLYDEKSGGILNSRDAQDIKNANGTTISGGVATVRLDALDNALQNSQGRDEYHVARIVATWSDGTTARTIKQEVRFQVRALTATT